MTKMSKILLIACSLAVFSQADAHARSVSILLQQSPSDAGAISPGTGVHNLELSSEMAISASPRPGYQFVYWLGPVNDPASSNTTVRADSPQIVVAVYERVEYDQLDMEVNPDPAAGLGGGGIVRSAGDLGGPAGFGGPGARPRATSTPVLPSLPENGNGDVPVPPGEDPDFPVPEIPEPATVALLAAGALMLRRSKLKKIGR